MTDILEILLKTPIPTILVIAGVFFIFVSIGGGFGAHVVADKIKPKPALMIGIILLLAGIFIYIFPLFLTTSIKETTGKGDIAINSGKSKVPDQLPMSDLATGTQSSLNAISTYLDIDDLKNIFPETQLNQIQENYPFILKALAHFNLADKTMLAVALATIRAENRLLIPREEEKSVFNTTPGGHPFDMYDNRRSLGNVNDNDGNAYRGRGYLQLTGRKNYEKISKSLGLGNLLVEQPDKVLDPQISAEILVLFLSQNEVDIRKSIELNDFPRARRLVNGGSHGVERYKSTYTQVIRLINEKGY